MARFNDSDDPRRRLLIKALTASMIAAGMPLPRAMAADAIYGGSPKQLPPGQSIYRMSGTVKVNGVDANLNTKINATDTIETGKDSELLFVVGGNSMILRENSNLTLENKKEDQSNLIIAGLRLLSGKLLSVSRSQGIKIQTQTATIGIRGTGVYLEADPELTYFCTCYGLADVQASSDPSSTDTVQAEHHDKPLYILAKEQAGKNIRRAGFINHSDQELMLIETLVGRTPPFVFPGSDYEGPRRDY